MIRAYAVLLDGKPIFRNKLALAEQRLSIETNIASPLSTGAHTLTLMSDAGGRSDVSGVVFRPAIEFGFCREFDRLEARSCVSQRNSTPLDWQPDRQKDFANNLSELSHNLARLQEDTAEVAAVDESGNLLVASHLISAIELRKYRPDGSILQDQLVRFCSQGFIAIHGIALRASGRLWLAGDTNACLSSGGLNTEQTRKMGAFLIAIDTSRNGEDALLYSHRLPDTIKSVSALDVDRDGNIYLAGRASTENSRDGFVFEMDSSGSKLLSSFPVPAAHPEALAINESGILYVAGHETGGVSLVGIDSDAKRIVYLARITQRGDEGLLAMTLGKAGSSSRLLLAGNGTPAFQLSLEPCRRGSVDFEDLPPSAKEVPDVALRLGIERLANSAIFAKRTRPNGFTIDEAPACTGSER